MTSKDFYVDTGDAIVIYDGSNIKPGDCSTVNTGQYTYNYATLIAGLSYLYNHVRAPFAKIKQPSLTQE